MAARRSKEQRLIAFARQVIDRAHQHTPISSSEVHQLARENGLLESRVVTSDNLAAVQGQLPSLEEGDSYLCFSDDLLPPYKGRTAHASDKDQSRDGDGRR